jgi:hypothetical protein
LSEAVDGRRGSLPPAFDVLWNCKVEPAGLPAPNGLCSAFGKEWIARKKIAIKEAIVRKDEEAEISAPQLDEVLSGIQESREGKEIRVQLTAEARGSTKKQVLVTFESPGFSAFSIWCDKGTSLGRPGSGPQSLLQCGHWPRNLLRVGGGASRLAPYRSEPALVASRQ